MLTRCPRCETVYRLRAGDLRRAHGRVRCGRCRHAFDALPTLTDEIPPGVAVPPPPATPPPEDYGPPRPPAEPASPPREDDVLFTDLPSVAGAELDLLEPPRRGGKAAIAWVLACLVLIASLAGQVAWQERGRIVEHAPAARAWYARVCAHIGCEAPPVRRLEDLALIARDVREHPRYRDALLVNATIVNRAPLAQAYPRLELVLFDTGGRVVGSRRFGPSEYLDASIDTEAGMPADVPVHVVLEVVPRAGTAAGFEFRFL